MLNVVCVKVKPEFDAEYVNKLYRGVSRHLSAAHTFACYTDDPKDVDCLTIAIDNRWPGWWAKMWIYQNAYGRTLYFDLDTVITGDIDFLARYEGRFASVENWWAPRTMAAGFLLFNEQRAQEIWAAFSQDPKGIIQRYRSDQEWLNERFPDADLLCKAYPEKFASYKAKVQKEGLNGESVVCFHGQPRPHAVNDPWMQEHWV